MRNEVEHCIKDYLKSFSVHEVGIYEIASYYLLKKESIPSLKEIEKQKKKEKEKKEKKLKRKK